jgi:hypothetical protein
MKRAAWKIAILLIPLLTTPTGRITAEDADIDQGFTAAILPWVNQLRHRWGLSQLVEDQRLQRTASLYAAELVARGVLSHVDERGRRALERFRDQGGTSILVGEIIGSGPDLQSITAAWENSQSHREVVGNPLWTHCGGGLALGGDSDVWVVLFTSRRIDPLEMTVVEGGYELQGRLDPKGGAGREPVLLSGIEMLEPLHWDPQTGKFSFLIPRQRGEIFHRLGYRSRSDALIVTDTFRPARLVTSDPGRERQ